MFSSLSLADHGSIDGVDGRPLHFAIAPEQCQLIDQTVGLLAKLGLDNVFRRAVQRANHGGERHGLAAGAGGALLVAAQAVNRLGG